MTEDQRRASRAVEEVLAALNVVKVVCVDDIYTLRESEQSVPLAIAWSSKALSDGKRSECESAWSESGTSVPSLVESEQVLAVSIRRVWEALDAEARARVLGSLAVVVGREMDLEGDQEHASLLTELVPPGIELLEVGPGDWERRGAAIIGDPADGERILCLFDHNLEGASGYSSTQGAALMDKALSVGHSPGVICGLLTHTASEEEEIEKAKELASELGRKRKDFLVLSKRRLANPDRFAHGLKMTVLNQVRDELAILVERSSRYATERARTDLLDVDIYDFDHMVLRSSELEGVWETETLFRLFDILRHRAFRAHTLVSPVRDALSDAIAEVRKVRRVATQPDPGVFPRGRQWEMRRLELYEDGALVNEAHLPLQLGDLFQIGLRKLVLVAQPCDLMLREDGSRSATLLTLLNITANRPQSKESSFPLDCFDAETGHAWYAKFRSPYYVSADVLDLSVFNVDGHCRLDTIGAPPSILHLPWVKRFQKLQCRFVARMALLSDFEGLVSSGGANDSSKQRLRECVTRGISESNLDLPTTHDDRVLESGARRIGRYRQAGAVALLAGYASFLARPAEPHDYTPPEMLADGVRKCPNGHVFPEAPYVAAIDSRKFHLTSCTHGKTILARPHLCLESRGAAAAFHREPCALCLPSAE